MEKADAVARMIQRMRPKAKFIAVEHSTQFTPPEGNIGGGFYTANLYDERIDANMVSLKHGPVMIQNTYISSFAYNLLLCWLFTPNAVSDSGQYNLRNRLVSINFKKFFAEQLYRVTNRVPSRSLLIESLIFESDEMRPIFDRKAVDSEFADAADHAVGLMSHLLTMHELAHHCEAVIPNFWEEFLQEHTDTIGDVYEFAKAAFEPKIVAEFLCDAFAVVFGVREYAARGKKFAIRVAAFSFASYAAMYTATASAEATASLWHQTYSDELDFTSIEPMPHVDHDVVWQIDQPFLTRARLVILLCQKLAEKEGTELFGSDEPFDLAEDIVHRMSMFIETVFDTENDTARRMSNLLAQAFTGHEKGMEYLYLRSKVFTSNRPEPLKI